MLRVGRPQAGAADATGPVRQSGLSVYINNGEQPYASPDGGQSEEWRMTMWNAIARDGRAAADMTYAFGPMSMEVMVSIDKQKNDAPESSRIWKGENGSTNEAAIHFTGIEMHLRQKHASIGTNLVSWMENIYRWREFDERPQFPPSAGINAREWWMFAGRAVVTQVIENRKRRNLANVQKSLKMIQGYVTLYERHSRNGRPHLKDLSDKEQEWMLEIEDERTFDTIVACRTIAWDRLLKYDLAEEAKGEERKMTLAQIEMVDPRRAFRLREPIKFKPDVSWAKVRLENERFSFMLSQASASLVHLIVEQFDVQAHMHGNGGGGATVSMQGLTVEDKFTHNPIFPNLIDRHDAGKGDQPVFFLQIEKKVESISCHDPSATGDQAQFQEKIQHTVR